MSGRFVRSIALLIVLTLAGTPLGALSADKADLKDVVAALEKSYSALQDVQADFSQKTVIAGINREQKGNGELLLKRPSSASAMFRFNYARPKQQIVSNGKQVWFYIVDNKQVMVSTVADMFKGGNSIALSYLTGLGHVSKDFTASSAKEPRDAKGNYQLDLVPKQPSPVLARLQLTVSAEAVDRFRNGDNLRDIFPVIASVVHDIGGNQTRIDYSRVRVNKGIDSSKFNFRVPDGVEVIKP